MICKQINGNTKQLITPFSNVGVYYISSNEVILIDSGHIHASRDLLKWVEENDLKVHTIINTHGHIDHVGGNFILQEMFNVNIVMPYLDHIYCEDISRYYLAFSTSAVEGLNVYGDATFEVTDLLRDETSYNIAGHTFEVIALKGHSANQKGIVTPDGVCFLGDALMPDEMLMKAKFATVSNLILHHASLEIIKTLPYAFTILGHGEKCYDNDALQILCDKNHSYFNTKCDELLKTIENEVTFDTLIARLNKQYGLRRNVFKYFVAERSIKAMLSYLEKKGSIEIRISNGMLSYCLI